MALNTVILMSGYGKPGIEGADDPQGMFNRCIKFWERFGIPIVVISPIDAPVKTNYKQLGVGKQQHTGDEAHQRTKAALFYATLYDYCILTESDTVCLCDKIEWLPGFHCCPCENSDKRFAASVYPMLPMMLDKKTATELFMARNEVDSQEGNGDRFLGALAQKLGIPLLPHNEPFWVPGNIRNEDLQLCATVVKNGTKWIHGVKSKEAHDCIFNNWRDNPWKQHA